MVSVLKDTQNLQQSIVYYSQALQQNPNCPTTLFMLANILKDTGDVPQAIACYSRALNIVHWYPEAFCNMVYSKVFICDWDNIKQNFEQLAKYTKYQVDSLVLPSVQPFHALVYPLAPEDKLIISKTYARFTAMQVQKYSPFPKQVSNEKIRVGYVSSDFCDHPLSHLMQSVFGMHDRNFFQVFCFALTTDDGSEYRRKIREGSDFFIDLSNINDSHALAETIYNYNIDVLVNLNGYTRGSKNEIFALRPGRIQISFMGFPGTMGADYIDYLISDKTTTPINYIKYYSENIIWMPHTYFVNDYMQSNLEILDPRLRPHRSGLLPENKFVFANFNQLYKIDPETFHIWMNILKRVPNSVLWLLRFPLSGEPNIKYYAALEGVDPCRIIFTDLAPKKNHINRCNLADLCLDTPWFNGHTTSCDLLWSGVPLLTLPLECMASRVASGLCYALECPELIMKSPEEYEQKAVDLALGPRNEFEEIKLPEHIRNRFGSSELKALRAKIELKRITAPLFNTQLWVHYVEKAYSTIVNLDKIGSRPKNIEILE